MKSVTFNNCANFLRAGGTFPWEGKKAVWDWIFFRASSGPQQRGQKNTWAPGVAFCRSQKSVGNSAFEFRERTRHSIQFFFYILEKQAVYQAASSLLAFLPNRSLVLEPQAVPFSNALPRKQQKIVSRLGKSHGFKEHKHIHETLSFIIALQSGWTSGCLFLLYFYQMFRSGSSKSLIVKLDTLGSLKNICTECACLCIGETPRNACREQEWQHQLVLVLSHELYRLVFF